MSQVRRQALEEVQLFESRAGAAGVPADIISAARYVLCATLDEAALSTPRGAESEWAQNPLLVVFHREAWGGEKFFDVLQRASGQSTRFIDLIELQYLCMALGFSGKYHVESRGRDQLFSIQRDALRTVRELRGPSPTDLSIRWEGLKDQQNRLIRYVPWWVVGAAALAMTAVVFFVYYSRLAVAAEPVKTTLARIGIDDFAPAAVVTPPVGPTLKQLLAPEHSLAVEENGARTLVTITASDLFDSGSADVNASYDVLFQRIAEALNRVPGRVLVIGHTDDQPIRSLQFQDNFELSRERAVSVARLLQKAMTEPARVTWSGAGSSKPRYEPVSSPENRARNRRVEIVHVRGA